MFYCEGYSTLRGNFNPKTLTIKKYYYVTKSKSRVQNI